MPDAVTPTRVAEALGVPRVRVSAAIGRDNDSVWVLRPRAVRVGRVRLVPAALDLEPEPGDVRLADTPAFGSGLHATTALCVEILDELAGTPGIDAVLDVGSGTGVLALAALRLGVPRAVAIDIHPEAIRATVDNAARNDLTGRLRVVQGGPEALAARWPLVVANVLAAPLVEMAPALAATVGRAGRLVLSGIATAVQPDVERAYRRLGMHVADVRVRDGWVAIVLNASW
jgi:ribosomal protein L11 methyltransferase